MTPLFLLCLLQAQAGDPALDEAAETAQLEITVYGDIAIKKARDQVIHQFEALNYRARERPDGSWVFRPPRGWMGKATFTPEGTITFSDPLVGFKAATYEEPAVVPPPEMNAGLTPAGTPVDAPISSGAGFWLFPAKRKVVAAQDRTLRAVQPHINAYTEVVRRTALEEQLASLPDRLDALWTRGVPLDGGEAVESQQDRRRAVLELWATRTDTPEGDRITEAIEAWLDAEVTDSDQPITEAERRDFEARRPDDRPLP